MEESASFKKCPLMRVLQQESHAEHCCGPIPCPLSSAGACPLPLSSHTLLLVSGMSATGLGEEKSS